MVNKNGIFQNKETEKRIVIFEYDDISPILTVGENVGYLGEFYKKNDDGNIIAEHILVEKNKLYNDYIYVCELPKHPISIRWALGIVENDLEETEKFTNHTCIYRNLTLINNWLNKVFKILNVNE